MGKLGFVTHMDDRMMLLLNFTLSEVNFSCYLENEKAGSLVISLSKTITFRAAKGGNKDEGYSPHSPVYL